MTAKLTEVATQRFIDNITSITPGALKGGCGASPGTRSATRSSSAAPTASRSSTASIRQTARVIGDDSNLIREFPPDDGRVNERRRQRRRQAGSPPPAASTASARSSSTRYEFDTELPDNLKAIIAKVVTARIGRGEGRRSTSTTRKASARSLGSKVPQGGVYAVAFRPDGKVLAAAGADGVVRLHRPRDRVRSIKEFAPVPVRPPRPLRATPPAGRRPQVGRGRRDRDASRREPSSSASRSSRRRSARPTGSPTPSCSSPAGSARARRSTSTRMVEPIAVGAGRRGHAVRAWSGPGPTARRTLTLRLGGQIGRRARHGDRPERRAQGRFRPRRRARSSRGWAATPGTCHGSAQGKNGFKLSLRGYDPIFDVRALTDDQAARRVNLASPDDSLMLLKPTGAVPHVGGAADPAGRAVLRDPPRLDRRRRQARRDHARRWRRSRSSPTTRSCQRIGGEAADPRPGHLRRRRGPRRHPRGVHRERQHRGRHGRASPA